MDPFAWLLKRYGEPVRWRGEVVARRGLRVRLEPDTRRGEIVGALHFGDEVDIVELIEKDGDTWARLLSLRHEYAAVVYRGERLMLLSAVSPDDRHEPAPSGNDVPSITIYVRGGPVKIEIKREEDE